MIIARNGAIAASRECPCVCQAAQSNPIRNINIANAMMQIIQYMSTTAWSTHCKFSSSYFLFSQYMINNMSFNDL